MNVSATGTSSLTSLYIQQLLGTSSTSSSGVSTSGSSATDLLSISDAGQSASQGSDPFQTDLKSLESAISSGDLSTAKSQYAAMLEKMKRNGQVPSDFAAIGTALDSGDLTAAAAALKTVEKNAASRTPPPQGGANPLKQDMDQLGSLLQSGDTTDAQTLFSSILSKLQGGSDASSDSTSSSTSSTSSASSGSSSTSSDSFTTYLDQLSQSLSSGDTSTALSAYDSLIAQLQAGDPGPSGSLARSMGYVAASAYSASTVSLG